jgi:hypothetical protein
LFVNSGERGTYPTGHELHPPVWVWNTSSSYSIAKLELEVNIMKCESIRQCSQKSDYLELHGKRRFLLDVEKLRRTKSFV